eukprot:COSAG01_NODE_29660_length_632_cov_2.724203_1_plen_150_part_01
MQALADGTVNDGVADDAPAPDTPPHSDGEAGANASAVAAEVEEPAARDVVVGGGKLSLRVHRVAVPGAFRAHAASIRVRVEIMGLGKFRKVGKSQSVLVIFVVISPVISTRTRRRRRRCGATRHGSAVAHAGRSRQAGAGGVAAHGGAER